MSRDEIISRAFAAIDQSIRPASIARIGGFRPPALPVTSWFGGHFVGADGDTWPTVENLPMLPLLQVRVDELPHRPAALQDIALFNVFIHPKELPVDMPDESGSHWLIRTYPSLDGLRVLRGQPESHVRPFPVQWTLAEPEGPQWDDVKWDDVAMREFNALPDSVDLFHDRYEQHSSTKVGGWPSYVQGSPGLSDSYVFQIGSEEKPHWTWGDNGNGYFHQDNGKWLMYWDCY